MPWNDRIREAAYTMPSGDRFTFEYENVSLTVDKKTTAFEFPDADGTFIQDLGHSGRKYPMRIFFSGDDYDLDSNGFLDGLLERGTGKLEHPIYGVVDVVPFGQIRRRDDLKTAANQAVIQVIFWETINIIYPSSQEDPASEVISAVDDYNEAASQEFAALTSLESEAEQAAFKVEYESLLEDAENGLQAIADTQEDVQTEFDAVKDSINESIDILIGEPFTLAFQTAIMIQAPSRALTAIQARLSAYLGLSDGITTGDPENANDFHTQDVYASGYVTGSILSVVNNVFTTKTEALEAAELVLNQLDAVTNWRDDNFTLFEQIDTGGAYQQLQDAVALTAGFLVEISFSLKQERVIVLDRNRTIIDLAAELYGSIDDQLDFLISSNDLSGSEILELPRGREIVYYV